MTTPLPEPAEYMDGHGALYSAERAKFLGLDLESLLWLYSDPQLRAYGAAEYKRGLKEASEFAEPYLYGIAAEIRKLGETP